MRRDTSKVQMRGPRVVLLAWVVGCLLAPGCLDSTEDSAEATTAGTPSEPDGTGQTGEASGPADTGAAASSDTRAESGLGTSAGSTGSEGPGNSTGEEGSGDGAGSSTGGDPPGVFEDDFERTGGFGDWQLENFNPEQNSGSSADTRSAADMGETRAGHLAIRANVGGNTPASSGWFEDNQGPLVYRAIAGDFVLTTHVTAGRPGDPSQPPSSNFNSAGLLVRRPGSRSPGQQDWLMFNLGFQRGELGLEHKITVDSVSTLVTPPVAEHAGELAICRRAQEVVMLSKLQGQSDWAIVATHRHPNLDREVEVGMMVNFWQTPFTIEATFDWIRIAPRAADNDCSTAYFNANLYP